MKSYKEYLEELEKYWMYYSISEERLSKHFTDDKINCLSIWISTWWFWEVIFAKMNRKRNIIATTIDKKWFEFSKKLFSEQDVESQISTRLENVSKKNNYENNTFDLVYARLVLHYLEKDDLNYALSELHRVTKKWGKLLVVVISTKNISEWSTYDEKTWVYTTPHFDQEGNIINVSKRSFHTTTSISKAISNAWFKIEDTNSYDERLCSDYERKKPSKKLDNLIEIIASK